MKAAFRAAALVLSLLPLWAGCSSIIGIEDARLEATEGTGGGTGEKTLCDQYCTAAMNNCVGEHKLYFSTSECLASCKVFPEGSPNDRNVNTIQCRLRFAQLAADVGEPEVNCPAAGPGGAGSCGDNCEGFCTMALEACSDELPRFNADFDGETCNRFCKTLPDDGAFNISQDEGDSVQCRLYHASAATLDAETHCRHVAGIGPCARNQPGADGG